MQGWPAGTRVAPQGTSTGSGVGCGVGIGVGRGVVGTGVGVGVGAHCVAKKVVPGHGVGCSVGDWVGVGVGRWAPDPVGFALIRRMRAAKAARAASAPVRISEPQIISKARLRGIRPECCNFGYKAVETDDREGRTLSR
jgi:hypothetical protein